MGHVVEQEPGQDENAEPARRGDEPQQLDPEQLRQFQQFQQFQEYLRFTEAQRQAGAQPGATGLPQAGQPGSELATQQSSQLAPQQQYPPAVPPPAQPPVASGSQPYLPAPREENLPATRPKIAAPRWLKRLGGKLLSALLLLIVLIIAGKLAWNYFFPPDDPDKPASETGGKQYQQTQYLPTQPYEAVRQVYELIDKNSPAACERFQENVRPVFARNFGAPDCAAAVTALHAQVTDDWAYAFSVRQRDSTVDFPPTITISSCSFPIKGGPSLGVFTLTRVDKGQWLITDHRTETCATPSR
ncbi:hypothetical protein [Amycolatopsis sp. CA-230715]|uniref:hypothetical protein n=1 Tax=Amycolatopsis sp. CA-230715 TaxID=2745196 RepID=UPI001C00FE01|nr:hypothetical protein [Amycolatopsis sp. CA-230715]QWF79707.1 hypothetical protein HUW46_03116 [Amycolatopsis sp. CA-230715]